MTYDDVDGEQLIEKKKYDDLLDTYNKQITKYHNLDQDMIFVRGENKELKDALKKLTDEQGFKKASEVKVNTEEPKFGEVTYKNEKAKLLGKSEMESIELFASTTDDNLITSLAFLMRKHPKKVVATIKGDQIISFGVENL